MKPIVLVIACIVLLILALYKYGRGMHANRQATSIQRKTTRNANAFSLDELRLNYLVY